MNIGNAIKTIRNERGINQNELAEKCGISQAALSQIENDVTKPTSETLEKICQELRTTKSLLYILSIEEDDVPKENKKIYNKLFPSVKDLVLKILENKS